MTPEAPRCPTCNGSGRIGADRAVRLGGSDMGYCTCKLGKELRVMDKRVADEDVWGLAQQDVRFPDDTSSHARLRAMLESVQLSEDNSR
jgi:hypothetical protein